jgi:hypothetical protein
VETDEGLRVLAPPLEVVADAPNVPAQFADAGSVVATMAMLRSDGLGAETAGAASTIIPRRALSTRAESAKLHRVNPGIDGVDHQVDPLPHLVAGQSLADHPADHLLATAATVEGIPVDAARLDEAVMGKRRCTVMSVRDPRLQDFLGTLGDIPMPRLGLEGKAEAFRAL